MTELFNTFATPPPPPLIKPDLKVAFILTPRFSLVPFAGFIDCLRHAADEADFSRQIYCSWSVIAPDLTPIVASCGVPITPNQSFSDATEYDYVVLVGGQLPWCMNVPEETPEFLRTAYEAGTNIIGLCTGSFILANAGLLDGKRCAVHIEHQNQFRNLFPNAIAETDQIYVDDGGIMTCPGGTSALDLAFTLIERHSGKARAVKALTTLLVDRHRASHHMPERLLGHLTSCGNWRVEQAVALMEQNFSNPYSIAALATRLNTSERQLNRAFQRHTHASPSTICRNLRLCHGQWLLLNTTRTITQIALECGFSDAAHFSRWFRKIYADSPSRFRIQRRDIGTQGTEQ
jgi:transcriptional regulator GlxA family with amidase domain